MSTVSSTELQNQHFMTADSASSANAEVLNVADPRWHTNRELSWLDFDDRVLQLASDQFRPLLERARFAAIFASNLDEFFMIRVAGLHEKVNLEDTRKGSDGRSADEVIDAVRGKLLEVLDRHSSVVNEDLLPAIANEGIRVATFDELDDDQKAELSDRFNTRIFSVLTPLAVGQGRPFPYISNLSLNLAVLVRDPEQSDTVFARIKIPIEVMNRFERLKGKGENRIDTYVPLEEIVAAHLDQLFPGMEIVDYGVFRVTRDADYELADDEDDVMRAVQHELRNRRFGDVVRVEIDSRVSESLRTEMIEYLGVEQRQVYDIDGLLDVTALSELASSAGRSDLLYRSWRPVTRPNMRAVEDDKSDLFAAMRKGDVLVHHPYDSFHSSVERFVEQASEDRDVLAIKMTVYRTNRDSSLLSSLARAAEHGKQTVALVELKARFDEQSNIRWAQKMEDTGVHVVYGHPALKTHTKCILVVRREGHRVRNYVHIGTGNYNARTASVYSDFGLFTCNDQIAGDVAQIFNSLTGFTRANDYNKALVAPRGLREGLLDHLQRCVDAHKAGKDVSVQIKCNALVDRQVMTALYAASQQGVKIEINVRGICCLRPGIPGLSETIRVRSLLGRFLEHARIYRFVIDQQDTLLIGSADLMERNLDNRVELLVPVEDQRARKEIVSSLDRIFADEAGSWELSSDGKWLRVKPVDPDNPRDYHQELIAQHERWAKEKDE